MYFSLSHVKIDFYPGDDLQTFYSSEARPDVELFMNWTHRLRLVRLMKSSTFGLGLRVYDKG